MTYLRQPRPQRAGLRRARLDAAAAYTQWRCARAAVRTAYRVWNAAGAFGEPAADRRQRRQRHADLPRGRARRRAHLHPADASAAGAADAHPDRRARRGDQGIPSARPRASSSRPGVAAVVRRLPAACTPGRSKVGRPSQSTPRYQMRVAGIRRTGGDVGMIDVPEPRPLADDEVLIQVRAAGVGNWDEFVRTGGWDVGRRPPMALGVEAAGLVTAVGSMVTEWAPGDEVMTHPLPLRDQGAWAPALIAPSRLVARKPAGVSWEEAAVFPVPALTAAQVLDEALGVGPGDRVLVNGAGGVTGRLLVALGSLRGAQMIAIAGPRSRAPVAALGARDVIDYHEQDWPDQVLAITDGAGVSAAVNATPDGARDAIRAVRDGGRLATITSDPPEPERGIAVASVYVRPDGGQLGALARLLAAGQLEISVATSYELVHAANALATAVSGRSGGAVALTL